MAVWPHALSGVAMFLVSSVYAGDDALPPPPDGEVMNEQAVFHLTLIINHFDSKQVVPSRGDRMIFMLPAWIYNVPDCLPISCRRERLICRNCLE
ncbi:Uncharacterised protein [Salmonella enterica subsp. arizonae]|uniref:Uncharacterized protein n=1 Tax=Salmonella enterica subsp. arizonae TaxID=59203 RepID=A0A379STE0_SALER|nr:Uncharacterised protein [Salmonella enterica subsp. arizonae]